MLSQSKSILLETIYKYGGFVTVPAIMAWKHVTDTGARKSINYLCNLGYLEKIEFSSAKNYPLIFRITGSGIFSLRRHQIHEIDEMYAYSILYKVIQSHTLFQLSGEGVDDILTENSEKVLFLKSLGFKENVFDHKMNHQIPFSYFGDYIIKGKNGFTCLYVDRPWNDSRNVLQTRLEHLQKFLKAGTVWINLMIATDRSDRKEAFEWAYDSLYGYEKPEKLDCILLDYCYSKL